MDLFKFTISDLLNAPRTITPLYVTDCGPLSLQNLPHKYSLLLVCWRQWLHGSTRLFCIVNISSEQWVQLVFFLLDLALKNAVLIKFSFWHRLPREALMRRRKKQAQVSMTDPAEWEGSSAGRAKGENHLYPFPFFAHFHFERTPVGLTLSSAFHRKPGGQTQPWPCLWIRRSPELLKDVWIHGREETGGTQYWLCGYRSGRGNKSIGQTVCTWSLAQRVAH